METTEMIPIISDTIKTAALDVGIIHIKTEQQTIAGIEYRVSIADVLSSRNTVYRVTTYEEPEGLRDYAVCLCKGAFFRGICKHIVAVLCKSRKETV